MNSPLFDEFKQTFDKSKDEVMTLGEYLQKCKDDPRYYENAPERMLRAIGEPKFIETKNDPRLSRIFLNRTIKVYPAFEHFYGMEETIESIVSFFKHSSQNLEERRQVLYLLGPVGGGKSSLAEKLKALMEQEPFYALAIERNGKMEISPVFETPLGLFDPSVWGEKLLSEFDIPKRYLSGLLSPWAVKRLEEDLDGDISKFSVVKMKPSKLHRRGIAKVEPGDETNQDISTLVGKVDIRKLSEFSEEDTDCYSFCGGLNRANQGLLEFVEMFKAPIKMLHPLITATQEGNYNGTQEIGAIPFNGIILAHSNESEWKQFKDDKKNEAFLDRICTVKVPYCLRVSDEVRIYKKLLKNSSLHNAVCAPQTLEMMAQFSILSRLIEPENSSIWSKMRIYDGENLKDTDPKAKSLQAYRDNSGVDEGMDGLSTRFAYKILSKVFNYDPEELAANPVHLLHILETTIIKEQFQEEVEKKYLNFIRTHLKSKYADFIGKEIQMAYLESYSEYGQNLFDHYIELADHWVDGRDYKDPDTGEMFDRDILNSKLEALEKPADIVNHREFRNEIVNYSLRQRAKTGKNPKWTSYEKLREVLEKTMFSNTEELLPVISFGEKSSKDYQQKHDDFVSRMKELGYTVKQVQLLVSWWLRVRQSK